MGMDMLCMALFCSAVNDKLIDFGYCGQSHADLWARVREAIKFLSYYPERSPEQRKKDGLDLPTYGSRGEARRLTYEQLVVTQRYLKEHEKRLIGTKKRLLLILDLKLNIEKRRAAARYCVELFSGLGGMYLWYCERPPKIGPSESMEELL
jgi:hypothetical protein